MAREGKDVGRMSRGSGIDDYVDDGGSDNDDKHGNEDYADDLGVRNSEDRIIDDV